MREEEPLPAPPITDAPGNAREQSGEAIARAAVQDPHFGKTARA